MFISNNENNEIYPEELFEMASVRSNNSDPRYKRLLAVNPDLNRNGAYFKYYKQPSYGKNGNQVARISFFKPEYITHKNEKHGIPTWKYPNADDLERLMDILKSPSSENPNYTVWTVLKYHWNYEKAFDGSLESYVIGEMDKKYENSSTKGNYVPYTLQIPDYRSL